MIIAATIFHWNFNSFDDILRMNSEYEIKSLPSVLQWILTVDVVSILTVNAKSLQPQGGHSVPPTTDMIHVVTCRLVSVHFTCGEECGISEHGPRFGNHYRSPGRHWLMGSDTGVVTSVSNLLRQCMDVVRLACFYVVMRRDAVSDTARWQACSSVVELSNAPVRLQVPASFRVDCLRCTGNWGEEGCSEIRTAGVEQFRILSYWHRACSYS